MIKDLLPRFEEVFTQGQQKYEVVRSIMIDGHEVAWMSVVGAELPELLSDQKSLDETVRSHRLFCECSFVEGLGWHVYRGYRHGVFNNQRCVYHRTALYLRHLELRAELALNHSVLNGFKVPTESIPGIVLDLLSRAGKGEFVEHQQHNFDGSIYLTPDTLVSITGQPYEKVVDIVNQMARDQAVNKVGRMITPIKLPQLV